MCPVGFPWNPSWDFIAHLQCHFFATRCRSQKSVLPRLLTMLIWDLWGWFQLSLGGNKPIVIGITGHRRICKSFNLISFTICVHHAAKPHHQVPSHVFDLGAAASLQRDMLRLCWFKTGILIITSIIMITFHNINNNNNK